MCSGNSHIWDCSRRPHAGTRSARDQVGTQQWEDPARPCLAVLLHRSHWARSRGGLQNHRCSKNGMSSLRVSVAESKLQAKLGGCRDVVCAGSVTIGDVWKCGAEDSRVRTVVHAHAQQTSTCCCPNRVACTANDYS